MKISNVLDLPYYAHGKGVIDTAKTEWFFQVDSLGSANAIANAVNNHDKLVDALNAITRDYIQLAESGDAGCWTPDDVEAIVNARNLLKELGHEI